ATRRRSARGIIRANARRHAPRRAAARASRRDGRSAGHALKPRGERRERIETIESPDHASAARGRTFAHPTAFAGWRVILTTVLREKVTTIEPHQRGPERHRCQTHLARPAI